MYYVVSDDDPAAVFAAALIAPAPLDAAFAYCSENGCLGIDKELSGLKVKAHCECLQMVYEGV